MGSVHDDPCDEVGGYPLHQKVHYENPKQYYLSLPFICEKIFSGVYNFSHTTPRRLLFCICRPGPRGEEGGGGLLGDLGVGIHDIISFGSRHLCLPPCFSQTEYVSQNFLALVSFSPWNHDISTSANQSLRKS